MRIINDLFAEQVALKNTMRKYQMIQEDRRHKINDVGNTLVLSQVAFDRRFKIGVDCYRTCALMC